MRGADSRAMGASCSMKRWVLPYAIVYIATLKHALFASHTVCFTCFATTALLSYTVPCGSVVALPYLKRRHAPITTAARLRP